MMKWTDLRLFTFREDGRNVFVAAAILKKPATLQASRRLAGLLSTVTCTSQSGCLRNVRTSIRGWTHDLPSHMGVSSIRRFSYGGNLPLSGKLRRQGMGRDDRPTCNIHRRPAACIRVF